MQILYKANLKYFIGELKILTMSIQKGEYLVPTAMITGLFEHLLRIIL